MHFAVEKDALVKALKDVTTAVATRVVQPILNNVLIESSDTTALKVQATDLDLAIEARTPSVVYTPGSITLPGKKLLEIISKLPSDLVTFQVNKETCETTVTCRRSKFSIMGMSADGFPKLSTTRSTDGVLMPSDVLRRAIQQTAFAAAGYESNSILGGVYMFIDNGLFECSATDGSRLAYRQEALNMLAAAGARVDGSKEVVSNQTATLEKPVSMKATIPAKACTEIVKLLDGQSDGGKGKAKDADGTMPEVRLAINAGQISFETDNFYLSSRLISGEYPRYKELFPTEYKYFAKFNREELMQAIQRVAVMSDDRTHLVKMHFEGESMQVLQHPRCRSSTRRSAYVF